MNRPSKRDYWRIETEEILDIDEYNDDLEKYCDELEEVIDFVKKVQTLDYERVQAELWQYQKALDKACALLTYDQLNAIPPKELLNFCMKDWKEYLLKDE